jgi:hypothetical protein
VYAACWVNRQADGRSSICPSIRLMLKAFNLNLFSNESSDYCASEPLRLLVPIILSQTIKPIGARRDDRSCSAAKFHLAAFYGKDTSQNLSSRAHRRNDSNLVTFLYDHALIILILILRHIDVLQIDRDKAAF